MNRISAIQPFVLLALAFISGAFETRQANGSLQKLLLQQLLSNSRSQQPQSNAMFQGGNSNQNGQNSMPQSMAPQSQNGGLLQNLLDFNRPQFDQAMNSGFSNGMSMGSNGQQGSSASDPTAKLLQLLQSKNNGNSLNNNFNGMDYQNSAMGGGQRQPSFMPQQNPQPSSTNSLLSLLLGSSNNGGGSQSQNSGLNSFMSSPSNDFVPSMSQQSSNSLFNNMPPSGGGNGMNSNSNNNILNELLGALGSSSQQSQPNNNMMGNSGNGQSLMNNNLPAGLDLSLITGLGGSGNGMNQPQRMPMSNQNAMSANDALAAALAGLLGNSNNNNNNNNGGGFSGNSNSNQPSLLSLLGSN